VNRALSPTRADERISAGIGPVGALGIRRRAANSGTSKYARNLDAKRGLLRISETNIVDGEV